MKTIFALILSMVAAIAAPVTPQTLFRAGEWQIDAGYAGRLNGLKSVQDGAEFGVNYYLVKNVGVGGALQISEFRHTEIDRAVFSLIGRLPNESLRLAPEARVGFAYDLEAGGEYSETARNKRGRGFDVFASVGAEYRLTRAIGIGVELRGVRQTESSRNYSLGVLRARLNF